MQENTEHHGLIPLEAVQEQELRRHLLRQARNGDADAKAKLVELYGVRVYSPADLKSADD